MDMFKTLLETLHGRLLLMEENVSYLRSEVEHKNTTIDQLIKVVNKLAPCSDSDTTYNNNVDIYNDNVSKYNSTPVNKNITTRKKAEPPDESQCDLQHTHCDYNGSSTLTSDDCEPKMPLADNITTRKKVDPPDDLTEYDFQHIHCDDNGSSSLMSEDREPKVPLTDQLASYKDAKHSKFLSRNEGMMWDGSTWKKNEEQEEQEALTPIKDVVSVHDDCSDCSDDVPLQDILNHLDDDRDIKRMDNLYEDWGDTSFSSDGGGCISQLRHVYKQPLPPEALWKKGTTLIIGDSMLGGIDETRLWNTKVRSKPGASIEDMFFQITPYLRKNPSNIICHVGTNNAKSDDANMIMEKLVKLKEYIMTWCPVANLVFSSLIMRKDDKHAAKVAEETNLKLDHLDTPLMDNSNLTEGFLGRRGLHLNVSGTRRLAMNLINVLRKFDD